MTASDIPHRCVVVGFDGSPASHVALSRAIQRVGQTGTRTVEQRAESAAAA